MDRDVIKGDNWRLSRQLRRSEFNVSMLEKYGSSDDLRPFRVAARLGESQFG